jgi:multisubunit Na+/H+ antiporter MnhB subunit
VTVVIERLAQRLLAPALIVAAALIVKGYADVGDGFSAGVIVALAIALQYIALGAERVEAMLPILRFAPAAAIGGLLVALAVGFAGLLGGDPPFTHWPLPGDAPLKIGSLEVITAVAFDLALFVLVVSVLVMLIHHLATAPPEDQR